MKLPFLSVLLFATIAARQASALRCNLCELADPSEPCGFSSTCEDGQEYCETLISKVNGNYTVVLDCASKEKCGADPITEDGLENCLHSRTNTECYSCCDEDNCNTAKLAFASIPKSAFKQSRNARRIAKVVSDETEDETEETEVVAKKLIDEENAEEDEEEEVVKKPKIKENSVKKKAKPEVEDVDYPDVEEDDTENFFDEKPKEANPENAADEPAKPKETVEDPVEVAENNGEGLKDLIEPEKNETTVDLTQQQDNSTITANDTATNDTAGNDKTLNVVLTQIDEFLDAANTADAKKANETEVAPDTVTDNNNAVGDSTGDAAGAGGDTEAENSDNSGDSNIFEFSSSSSPTRLSCALVAVSSIFVLIRFF